MSTYKILASGSILKDGETIVAQAADNPLYQDYLAWVSLGNIADAEIGATQTSDEILEQAMRKCEAHFEACGYTSFRVIDLLSQLSSTSTTDARKSNIVQVQAWMQSCRDVTLAGPLSILDGSVSFSQPPVKYVEV